MFKLFCLDFFSLISDQGGGKVIIRKYHRKIGRQMLKCYYFGLTCDKTLKCTHKGYFTFSI